MKLHNPDFLRPGDAYEAQLLLYPNHFACCDFNLLEEDGGKRNLLQDIVGCTVLRIALISIP